MALTMATFIIVLFTRVYSTGSQVEVDMEYHRTMFDLHKQVNPKEVIVGW